MNSPSVGKLGQWPACNLSSKQQQNSKYKTLWCKVISRVLLTNAAALTSAPALIKIFTVELWPFCEARCNEVVCC